MKVIKDYNPTPVERSRARYQKLFEEQVLFKASRVEKVDYLKQLKEIIVNAL